MPPAELVRIKEADKSQELEEAQEEEADPVVGVPEAGSRVEVDARVAAEAERPEGVVDPQQEEVDDDVF